MKKFHALSPAWLLVGSLALSASMTTASEHAAAANEALATEVLAGGCAGCHGTDGQLSGLIPAIAGRPMEELELQLLRFKIEENVSTVMNRIAAGYSNEELARLAQYFSEQ